MPTSVFVYIYSHKYYTQKNRPWSNKVTTKCMINTKYIIKPRYLGINPFGQALAYNYS